MATVTDTIQKTGGDYNTIAGWEADTNLNSGADIWKGVISDNEAYDEAIVMNVNGTGTSSYAWLTVDSANRTSIVGYATGRARLDYTGGNTAAIQIEGDYARVSGLQILRSGAGTSDEGIRVTGADNVLISRCVIWHDDATVHTDGIYITGASSPTSIDNCVIWGWGRAGIHSQSSGTRTINVDHCTIGKCATNTGSAEYGLIGSSNGSTDTYNVYNTIALENASGGAETGEIEQNDPATTSTTLNGSHIVVTADSSTYIRDMDTDNVTNWVAAGDQWSTTAPGTAGVRVVDDTIAAWDATLVDDANNVALEAGTDRQGSEPDARQDFSTDLLGNSRPTSGIDIGCHQLSSSGATVSVGLASETDTALAVTVSAGALTTAVGLATETDTALAVTVVAGAQTVAVGLASETDTALAATVVAGTATVAVGLATETDTGLAVTVSAGALTTAVGLATETDTALAVTASIGAATVAVGLATETDTGLAVTVSAGAVSVAVGLASETDTALAVTISTGVQTVAVGLASETDTGLAITVSAGALSTAVGLASETDTALAVTVLSGTTVAVGLASETDTALAVTITAGAVSVAVGLASETDTALAATVSAGALAVAVGLATETDTGLAITVSAGAITTAIGLATETDTALAITVSGGLTTVTVGLATETDTGLAITITTTAAPSTGGATWHSVYLLALLEHRRQFVGAERWSSIPFRGVDWRGRTALGPGRPAGYIPPREPPPELRRHRVPFDHGG